MPPPGPAADEADVRAEIQALRAELAELKAEGGAWGEIRALQAQVQRLEGQLADAKRPPATADATPPTKPKPDPDADGDDADDPDPLDELEARR